MHVEVVPGGYKSETFTSHLALTGLSAQLRQLGFRLQRYERGPRGRDRPVINLSVRRPPDDVVRLDVPVELHLEPYASQTALNVHVELRGLRAHIDAQFGLPAGHELGTRAFIPNYDGDYLTGEDAAASAEPTDAGDHRPRSVVMRAIRARRGAKGFRDRQLARFGGRCAMSGCAVADVLEAAHIRPYRTEEDNAGINGVLLRSDLHTLFDLDLVAIHPDAFVTVLHPSVREPPYGPLHDGAVRTPADGFDAGALRQRWAAFKAKAGAGANDGRPATPPAVRSQSHGAEWPHGQVAPGRPLRLRSPADLPVRELLPPLQTVEAKLARERGPFELFGLFRRRRHGPGWTVVAAAPWFAQVAGSPIALLIDELGRIAGPAIATKLSRFEVYPGPRFIETVHALVRVEHGVEVVGPGDYGTVEIARGYVITSRPLAKADATPSAAD